MAAPSLFVSALSAVILATATLAGWLALRRRRARVAAAVLVLGGLLVVGCFVPPPSASASGDLEGLFGGAVSLRVDAPSDARVVVGGGGTGRIEGDVLSLECAARCDFLVPGARLAEADGPLVTVEGGPLVLRAVERACLRAPVTLRLVVAQECVECGAREFVVAEGTHGTRRLTAGPAPSC